MLFFTQCFGAVLDLIHLRFQHNKAKRVFAAAGQLVCVVNPTHNLKVSGWLLFDVPVARVQILPRRRRGGGVASGTFPRSPGRSRQRSSPCYTGRCWAPEPALGSFSLSGCVDALATVCVSLPGRGDWSQRLFLLPHAVSLGVGGGGVCVCVRSEGVGGSRGRPPPSPKYLWASV